MKSYIGDRSDVIVGRASGIAPDGTAVMVVARTSTRFGDGIVVYKATDGLNWTTTYLATPKAPSTSIPLMAGVAYIAATNTIIAIDRRNTGGDITIRTSTDYGETWNTRVVAYGVANTFTQFSYLGYDSVRGRLMLGASGFNIPTVNTVVLIQSSDLGNTWTPAVSSTMANSLFRCGVGETALAKNPVICTEVLNTNTVITYSNRNDNTFASNTVVTANFLSIRPETAVYLPEYDRYNAIRAASAAHVVSFDSTFTSGVQSNMNVISSSEEVMSISYNENTKTLIATTSVGAQTPSQYRTYQSKYGVGFWVYDPAPVYNTAAAFAAYSFYDSVRGLQQMYMNPINATTGRNGMGYMGVAGALPTPTPSPTSSQTPALPYVGSLVMGGRFTSINGTAQTSYTMIDNTGTSVESLNLALLPATAAINGATPVPNTNELIIWGNFTSIGGIPAPSLARIDRSGTINFSFTPTPATYGVIITMATDGVDSYVFTSTGVNRLTKMDANGVVDANWGSAITVSGSGNPVIHYDATLGKYYVGTSTSLFRVNADGTLDNTFAAVTVNERIISIGIQPDGLVVAYGFYTLVNGSNAIRLTRYFQNGDRDTTFNPAPANNAAFTAGGKQMLITSAGIYVTGTFTSIAGYPRNYIARLKFDGNIDTKFLPLVGGTLYSIEETLDKKIVIAGPFTTVNNVSRPQVARLTENGILDTTFTPTVLPNSSTGAWFAQGFNGPALTPTPTPSTSLSPTPTPAPSTLDDVMYFGSNFTLLGKSNTAYLLSNDTGTVRQSTLEVFSGTTYAGVPLPGTRDIIVYGGFTTVNGVTGFNGIARLDSLGGLNTNFTPTAAQGGNINDLIRIDNDTFIYTVTNVTRLWKMNGNGIVDNTWGTGVVMGDYTFLAYDPAINKIYAAANIGVRRLNLDGTIDTTFPLTAIGNRSVRALQLQPDGNLLIWGNQTGNGLIRVTSAGAIDTTFNPSINSLPPLTYGGKALLATSDFIYIGGAFTTVNGVTRGQLARLRYDGTLDTTFVPTFTGSSATVYSVHETLDRKLLVSGAFTTVNGTARSWLARLRFDGTLDTTFVPAGSGTFFNVAENPFDQVVTPTPTRTPTPTPTPSVSPSLTSQMRVIVDNAVAINNGGASTWAGITYSEDKQLYVAVATSSTVNVWSAYSSDGYNWNNSNLTAGHRGVEYSPTLGMFVAANTSGTGIRPYSTDGITWVSPTPSSITNTTYQILWVEEFSAFFAVCARYIGKSEDGINWSFVTLPGSSSATSIAYSPTLNTLVVTGFGGAVFTSTDGNGWVVRASGTNGTLGSVVWNPSIGRFVAFVTEGANGGLCHSINGVTWSVVSTTSPLSAYISDTDYVASVGATISTSTAGAFILYYNPVTNSGLRYTVGSALFSGVWSEPDQQYVGVGDNGRVSVLAPNAKPIPSPTPTPSPTPSTSIQPSPTPSPTPSSQNVGGLTWTERTAANAINWNGVAYSPELDRYVAVGSGGTADQQGMISSDGITWTASPILAEAVNWQYVGWNDSLSKFIAAGGARFAESPDGLTWTRSATTSGSWNSVAWSPSLGIMVGVASSSTVRVASSPNGTVWTNRSPPNTTSAWSSVAWSEKLGMFVAVAQTSIVGTSKVMTSVDGVTWTLSAPDANIDYTQWRSVIWSDARELFVAVGPTTLAAPDGPSPAVMTSVDGITWTPQHAVNVPESDWSEVVWSDELNLFVAVASTGTIRTMTSPDGITWSGFANTVADPKTLTSVIWSAEQFQFVAVGASTVITGESTLVPKPSSTPTPTPSTTPPVTPSATPPVTPSNTPPPSASASPTPSPVPPTPTPSSSGIPAILAYTGLRIDDGAYVETFPPVMANSTTFGKTPDGKTVICLSSYNGNGATILVSEDGKNFTSNVLAEATARYGIAYNPNTNTILYVTRAGTATTRTMIKSTDLGVTWSAQTTGTTPSMTQTNIYSMAYDTVGQRFLLWVNGSASANNEILVLQSVDDGATWTAALRVPNGHSIRSIAVNANAPHPVLISTATAATGTTSSLYASTVADPTITLQTIPGFPYIAPNGTSTPIMYSPTLDRYAAYVEASGNSNPLMTMNGDFTNIEYWPSSVGLISPREGIWSDALGAFILASSTYILRSYDGKTWAQDNANSYPTAAIAARALNADDANGIVQVVRPNSATNSSLGYLYNLNSPPTPTPTPSPQPTLAVRKVNLPSVTFRQGSVGYSPSLNRLVAHVFAPVSANGFSRSDDLGETWNADGGTFPASPAAGNQYRVIWVEELGKFVTAGTRCMSSVDGANWTISPTATNSYAIAWSPTLNLGVVATGGGNIYTTTDFVTFTTRTAGTTANVQDMIWVPELGMFVGAADNTASGGIIFSTNGINWTAINPAAGASANRSVAYSPELATFLNIAVANSSKSLDARNWLNTGAIPNITAGKQVLWYSDWNRYFVFGNGTATGNNIVTSTTGAEWSLVTTVGTTASDAPQYGCVLPGKNRVVSVTFGGQILIITY